MAKIFVLGTARIKEGKKKKKAVTIPPRQNRLFSRVLQASEDECLANTSCLSHRTRWRAGIQTQLCPCRLLTRNLLVRLLPHPSLGEATEEGTQDSSKVLAKFYCLTRTLSEQVFHLFNVLPFMKHIFYWMQVEQEKLLPF